LSDEVVDTVIALGSWRRLFDHQLRWARTYRICRPGGYFGSIVTHGTFWALSNVLYHGFSPASCAVSLAAVALRHFNAAHLMWRCLGMERKWSELLLIVPKDLFVLTVWFLAFAGNTVLWSGRRFRVTRNGEMVDLFAPATAKAVDWEVAVPEPTEERRRSAGGKR
jgi:ceramide glucosyltransferase